MAVEHAAKCALTVSTGIAEVDSLSTEMFVSDLDEKVDASPSVKTTLSRCSA